MYTTIRRDQRTTQKKYCTIPRARIIQQNVLTTSSDVSDNGRILKKLKYISKSSDSLRKYRKSDFYLENLIETGAISNLTNVSISRDNLSTIDNLSSKLDSLTTTETTE